MRESCDLFIFIQSCTSASPSSWSFSFLFCSVSKTAQHPNSFPFQDSRKCECVSVIHPEPPAPAQGGPQKQLNKHYAYVNGLLRWLSGRVHLPTQDMRLQSLGWEDPLEEGRATHSSTLAWRMPWAEKPVQTAVHGVTKSWTGLSD